MPNSRNRGQTTVSSGDTASIPGRFAYGSSNALGHNEERRYHPGHGKLLSLTGPNGLTTTFSQDFLGRPQVETRADGSQTLTRFDAPGDQCPAGTVYQVSTAVRAGATQLAPDQIQCLDLLEREIRSAKQGFNGRWVYKDTKYNAKGQAEQISRPYFAGNAPIWILSKYDDFGRPTSTIDGDGETLYAYSPLTVVTTDVAGRTRTQVKNALGKLITSTDAQAHPPTTLSTGISMKTAHAFPAATALSTSPVCVVSPSASVASVARM